MMVPSEGTFGERSRAMTGQVRQTESWIEGIVGCIVAVVIVYLFVHN